MASQAQAQARPFAVATLLTSDSYLPGALTAIQSLLDVEGASPSRPFDTVCILTPATVGHESIQAAETVFDHVIGVEEITTTSWDELDLLGECFPSVPPFPLGCQSLWGRPARWPSSESRRGRRGGSETGKASDCATHGFSSF